MKSALNKLRPNLLSRLAPSSDGDYFFVELEDVHRTWYPGDTVRGNVILVLYKPQKITSVDLTFAGTVLVKSALVKGKGSRDVLFEQKLHLHGRSSSTSSTSNKPPSELNSETDLSGSLTHLSSTDVSSSRMSVHTMHTTHSHMTQASGNSHMSITTTGSRDSASSTHSSSSADELEIGEHRFAFVLEIPRTGLYNSLEFERGSISYVITAVAKRHGPLHALYSKRILQLVCPVDVGRIPSPTPSTLSVEIRKRKKQEGIITTTLELGKGGYLRGESFPVKISIQHVKCVKCLRGLVVTLCRFSKVSCNDDEPQSYRKDLSQTVSPLYTDPVTFASTISTTLRIPTDVFPTTKGHELVSFNYCVEVVIDLAGKWDLEEDRTGFLHTDRLKRNKGVVSLWTEVIIGTERRRYRSDSRVTPTPRAVNRVNSAQRVGSPGHVNFDPSVNNHPRPNSITSTSPSSLSEKQLMRLREEALLPSEPASISSPSLDAIPSAPEYVGEGASEVTNSAIPVASHSAHSTSDKNESELLRLQGMASSPFPNEDEDHVPQYKEKEKEPEEVTALHLSELASQPPLDGPAEEDSVPSAPVVNGFDHRNEPSYVPPAQYSPTEPSATPPTPPDTNPPHTNDSLSTSDSDDIYS